MKTAEKHVITLTEKLVADSKEIWKLTTAYGLPAESLKAFAAYEKCSSLLELLKQEKDNK